MRVLPALAALLFASCASTSHVALLRDYESAANAGDVDAVVELFEPDAKIYIERELIARGHEQIRRLYAYDAARGARRQIAQIDSDGAVVRAVMTANNEFIAALGIPPLVQPVAFQVSDEARFAVLWTGKAAVDSEALQRQQRFYAWMERTHPAEYERLVARGTAYGPEIGERFVELARAWRASAGSAQ